VASVFIVGVLFGLGLIGRRGYAAMAIVVSGFLATALLLGWRPLYRGMALALPPTAEASAQGLITNAQALDKGSCQQEDKAWPTGASVGLKCQLPGGSGVTSLILYRFADHDETERWYNSIVKEQNIGDNGICGVALISNSYAVNDANVGRVACFTTMPGPG
jgi:hypothetical protein